MFFRIQNPNITLEQMQNFSSEDGGDGLGSLGGVCACESVSDLINNTAFTTKYDLEVVVFRGEKVCDIYDGVRVVPSEIVDRISAKDFYAMSGDSDSVIYEYE